MNQKGLTLIEVLITITILALLAGMAIPLSELTVKRQKEVELKRNLRVIRLAIDNYKKAWDEGRIEKELGTSGYPPDLLVLVEGVKDVKDVKADVVIKFLRRIPKDPTFYDPYGDTDAIDTWGLRSYDSDYDSPSEGDDVFDVYSLSSDIGINGSEYSGW